MTPHDAFLAAIIEHADEDWPRLQFADWLEEHGQPERAEFIRVQCEIAELRLNEIPPHPNCDCCEAGSMAPHKKWCKSDQWVLKYLSRQYKGDCLRRRERELWAVAADEAMQLDEPLWGIMPRWHIAGWSPNQLHLVKLCVESHPEIHVLYRHGFVECVSCTTDDWLTHGPALVRAAPLREVRLTDRKPISTYRMVDPVEGFLWIVGRTGPPGNTTANHQLAAAIGKHMPAELRVWQDRDRWVYRTEADAWKAASIGCLAWAKSVPVTPACLTSV